MPSSSGSSQLALSKSAPTSATGLSSTLASTRTASSYHALSIRKLSMHSVFDSLTSFLCFLTAEMLGTYF